MTMTTAIDDIQALEARHVLQTYRRAAGHVRARPGRAAVRRRGPRVSRPAVGHRRRVARACASADWRARSPSRRRRCIHTSNLFFHPLQGQLGRAAGAPVRAAARVLLQQRHRSGRSVPEVRAPLLVHAAASRAPRSSRSRNRFTAARSARCRSRRTSTTARRSSRCCRASRFVPANDAGRARRGGVAIDRGDHRRAGSGRRRRPAADAGVCRRHQRGVRQDRRAAHRRRSAERPRPHRLSVLLRRRSA